MAHEKNVLRTQARSVRATLGVLLRRPRRRRELSIATRNVFYSAASLMILPMFFHFPKNLRVPAPNLQTLAQLPTQLRLVAIFQHKQFTALQADLASDLQVLKGGRASAEKAPERCFFWDPLFFFLGEKVHFFLANSNYLIMIYVYIYICIYRK